MNFPKSFSSTNKPFVSSKDIASIIEGLKQYELDSHIEIVLLGFRGEVGKLVENHLNHLSSLPSLKREGKFLKEKLIFRVSISKLPEKTEALEKNTTLLLEEFVIQLKNYHLKSASKTSLFILNIPKNYLVLPSTFISPSGFAFTHFNDDTGINQHNMKLPDIAKLSVLIYRSAEQLIPEVRLKTFSKIHRHVMARIFVLCGFPLRKCIPDNQLTTVFESLSHSFGTSSFIRFQYNISVISITDSMTIMYALLASLGKYSSPWNSHRQRLPTKIAIHTPAKLLELLLNSSEISDILTKDSSTIPRHGILVPILSLLLPDDLDAIFPSFPASSLHSWYLSPILSVSSSKGIALLRPARLAEYARGSLKHSIQYGTNLWSRSNPLVELKRDAAFERRELLDQILALVWEITPSNLYFRPSEQVFVQEDLWLDAYSTTIHTFRDDRVVYRQLIIQLSEHLLNRLSTSLIYHQSVSINEGLNIFQGNILTAEKFQGILKEFDQVASDFSHLQYNLALTTLEGIDVKLSEMTGLLDSNSPQEHFSLNCRTFETEDLLQNITLPVTSYFRLSSVFIGFLVGFLVIAAFFQFFHFESKRGGRRVRR
jgi:hypothetical protein